MKHRCGLKLKTLLRISLPFSSEDLKTHHETSAEVLADPKDVVVKVAMPGGLLGGGSGSPACPHISLTDTSQVPHHPSGASGGDKASEDQELSHHLFPCLSLVSASCWGICFTVFCASLPPAGGTWLPWVEMVKSCLQIPTFNGQSLTLFFGNWNAGSLGVSILNIRGVSSRKGWMPREKLRMPWGSWCAPERALICHVWVIDYVSWLVVFSFNFLTCKMGILDLSSYS